ncbi:RluA family pseudouridine synthase [Hydrogenoanaerobacterium sp.]|uniref:RluA family pseudouridine synthase n=1 Tax=Hydrogenoanaerobacterium sp. TaxID=2953763 RepID=UPI0028A11167|nr:RluA family pseudouridine synthase [Hydrogenoanaerobacterium sp.]
MLNKLQFEIPMEDATVRIDKWIAGHAPGITRTAAQRLCDENMVLVCGKAVGKNYKLRPGDMLEVTIPAPQELDIAPQDIPLEIIYQDSDLLVVNKPKGMVVHPAAGNYDGTMVNALLHHCKGDLSGINGVIRPGIVHRIDKNTSGLLIVAKNDKAHTALAAQIKAHTFTRIYETVVYGNVKQDSGTIDAPIGRHPTNRKKMCVIEKNSRNAVTHFEVLARYNGFTHLLCRLETGRTHQIRVHLAYIGHPVAGDEVYGPKKVIKSLEGQCLHARVIGFIHPTTGEYLEFTSDLPNYFIDFLNTLRQ